mmetsp:Transcript_4543/g.16126  ORF Transcript_4543/g.16126 Transcript_4543/m.16126 type:complete len:201 (+) Transcript_4543:443-1045(+)
MTCSIGVIPVPPAIIPRCVTSFRTSASPVAASTTVNSPRSVYVTEPTGPSNVISSPGFNASSFRVITPWSYTLTQKSTNPRSSSDVIGVYGRVTTSPVTASANDTRTCCPTGRPRTCFSDGSANRSTRASAETSVFEMSFRATAAPGPGSARSVPGGYVFTGREDTGSEVSFIAVNLDFSAEHAGQTKSSLSSANGLVSW